jgi:Spy/CpxP family protein refolding chaperone
MNKKNIYKVIIVFIVIGMLMLTGCYRHTDRKHSSEKNSDRLTNYIAKELELNEEQRAQLNRTIINLMAKKEEVVEDNSLRDEIFAQLGSEKVDEASLKAIISLHMKEMEDLTKTFVFNLSEFHRTLTPEQKKKLASLIEVHQDRGHKHRRTYSHRKS